MFATTNRSWRIGFSVVLWGLVAGLLSSFLPVFPAGMGLAAGLRKWAGPELAGIKPVNVSAAVPGTKNPDVGVVRDRQWKPVATTVGISDGVVEVGTGKGLQKLGPNSSVDLESVAGGSVRVKVSGVDPKVSERAGLQSQLFVLSSETPANNPNDHQGQPSEVPTVSQSPTGQVKNSTTPVRGATPSPSSVSITPDQTLKSPHGVPSTPTANSGSASNEQSGRQESHESASSDSGSGGQSVDRVGDSQVQVGVDPSALAGVRGGDWVSRASLVVLPACVLVTPERQECQRRDPVATSLLARGGDQGRVLRAEVGLGSGPVVVAAEAGAAGASGDFKATSLASAGSWSAGGSAGGFSYSYPFQLPKIAAGPVPSLGLTYSSQAVDGRTTATNNQPSVVGEGWELAGLGFIERQYKACEHDQTGGNNKEKTGDLCWAGDNATVSMGGHSGELISAGNGVWRLRNDDGTRFEKYRSEFGNCHELDVDGSGSW